FLPMGAMTGEPPLVVVGLAAAVCILPGAFVLLAAERLREQSPEVRIAGVLLTTAFRMVATVGGGALVWGVVGSVREHVLPFVAWGIVFYLATLFVETRLLYIDSSGYTSHGSSK